MSFGDDVDCTMPWVKGKAKEKEVHMVSFVIIQVKVIELFSISLFIECKGVKKGGRALMTLLKYLCVQAKR